MNFDAILEISRFVLGAGLVAANVAVWYGVWLERDSAPIEVQHKGWRILVRGLAAETAIGFLVFALDTSISARQQNEIAAAQQRAANAELEAGHLGVDVHNLRGFVAAQEREISTQFSGFETFAAEEKSATQLS
jgi:hypothetical protein